MAGLALSRRLGPASRLVPFLAARSLRHARPRALRGGADARLRARRRRAQDVEIARQRHRAAGRDEAERRRHPAAVGRRLGLCRGSAHRPGDPEAPWRRLSPAAQHAALSARRARRLFAGRGGRRRGRCRSSSAGCLHRLAELDGLVRRAIEDFDFHAMFTALHNFCAVDLSAFYFDIRKDRLYCDARRRRRAARHAHGARPHLRLPGALARADPLLHRRGSLAGAARRRAGAQRPSRTLRRGAGGIGATPALGARWAELRDLRRVVTGALELERGAKRIGSSLQAAVELFVPERLLAAAARRRSRRAVHHLGRHGPVAAPPPEDAFTLPDVAGIGVVVSPARRASAASAAGGCCPRSAQVAGPRRSLPALRRGRRRGARSSAAAPADAGARARRGAGGRGPRPAQQALCWRISARPPAPATARRSPRSSIWC